MDFLDFTAGDDDGGRRLDKIARSLAERVPLSEIYKCLRKGLLRVNGKRAAANLRISPGDVISLPSFLLDFSPGSADKPRPSEKDSFSCAAGPEKSAESRSLNIVFENDNFLVLNKPYDVPVHSGGRAGKSALDVMVREYLSDSGALSRSVSFSPGPLHRLDRKTSGLIVFSKSLAGARWFSERVRTRSVKKTYHAVILGHLPKEKKWKDYILCDNSGGDGFHTVDCRNERPGAAWKIALTSARPEGYGQHDGMDVTLAEVSIQTGRKHQIRAQCASHGYPLLGDTAYGSPPLPSGHARDFYLAATSLALPEEFSDNPAGFPPFLSLDADAEFFDIIKYCDIKKIGV